MKEKSYQEQKLNTEISNQKKSYEVPQLHRHDPLESVSTTYYYYTYG